METAAGGGGIRIYPSKLTPPAAFAGQVLRQALVASMLAPESVKLVLVRAPAGFGKTTLMQQYRIAAQKAGHTVHWVNLDSADNDVDRFAALLAAGFGGGDAQGGDLIERIATYPTPFAIMLDEVEVIRSPEVLDYIRHVLEVLPPWGRLVMASRNVPAIGLGRIRARGHLLEIGPAALRFSLDEVTAFIRERQGLPLRDREIATLHRCTEGWAVALYLATLSLHTRNDHAAFVQSFAGTNLDLAQYLAEDILASQSAACQEFLLQTSVLDRLCAPLCDAILGRADSQQMIEFLEGANLFIFRLDEAGTWYRYHNLFASFLRSRLDRFYPGRATALHRSAGDWYAAEGRRIEAVEHLLAGGAVDDALAQVALCVPDVQLSGGVRQLLQWYDHIPREALTRSPRLSMTCGWALTLYRRFDDAVRLAEGMEQSQPAGEERERASRDARLIRSFGMAMREEVEACLESIQTILDHVTPAQRFQYRLLTNILLYCLTSTCRYDEARQALARAAQRDGELRPSIMQATTDSFESIIDLLQGRLGDALARLRTASGRYFSGGQMVAADGRTALGVPLALALYEADEIDEADRVLNGLMPLSRGGIPNDPLIIAHVLMSRIAMLRGDHERGQEALAALEEIGRQHAAGRVVCTAWLERARVATIAGRFDAAEQALRSAGMYAQWVRPGVSMYGNDVDTPFIGWARLRIARGDCTGLAADLQQAIDDVTAAQRHRCALKLRILLALCLDKQGQAAHAESELVEALRVAGHEGFMRTFLEEGEGLRALVQKWAAARRDGVSPPGIAPHFLAALLEKLGVPAEQPGEGGIARQAVQAPFAEALSFRELEVLGLLAGGMRNKAIADKMSLSEFTVKAHLRNINAKLGARSRTEAIAIARSRGLLT